MTFHAASTLPRITYAAAYNAHGAFKRNRHTHGALYIVCETCHNGETHRNIRRCGRAPDALRLSLALYRETSYSGCYYSISQNLTRVNNGADSAFRRANTFTPYTQHGRACRAHSFYRLRSRLQAARIDHHSHAFCAHLFWHCLTDTNASTATRNKRVLA